jgi:hypothetical protein
VRLIVASVAAALLMVLVGTQLLLPPYLEGRVEDRLTEDGGNADVSLEALPALRLLFHDGDKIEIRGDDLRMELQLSDLRARTLDDLDGFDEVDMRLSDLLAGPFRLDTFDLVRGEDDDSYRLRMVGTTSAGALVDYAAAQLPGLLAPLAGTATGLVQDRGRRIPIDLIAQVDSEDGRARVVGASATVAGLQVGPLVELLTGAVVSQI